LTTGGLAAFDFDGTLRRGDSLLPFLTRVAGRGTTLRTIAGSAIAVARRARVIDRDHIKSRTFAHLLAGRDAALVGAAGTDFGESLTSDLRPDVVARLREHQRLGHRIVIVSASLTIYLRTVADHLQCELASTDLVEVDGRLTGEIEGRNCRGPEKVARLRRLIDARPDEVWAYGDSRGDDEMLAWADHGVRIGRAEINARP